MGGMHSLYSLNEEYNINGGDTVCKKQSLRHPIISIICSATFSISTILLHILKSAIFLNNILRHYVVLLVVFYKLVEKVYGVYLYGWV